MKKEKKNLHKYKFMQVKLLTLHIFSQKVLLFVALGVAGTLVSATIAGFARYSVYGQFNYFI